MRRGLALAALLPLLAGCVVPPPGPVGYGYPQSGYPQSDYPQFGYPQAGYPGANYGQPDYGYQGYAYNGGSPTLLVEGATVPLIFSGGGWGYWDRDRRWNRAPDHAWRHLEERHPGGAGYRPWGGGGGAFIGRPEAPRQNFAPRPDFRFCAQPGFTPNAGFTPQPRPEWRQQGGPRFQAPAQTAAPGPVFAAPVPRPAPVFTSPAPGPGPVFAAPVPRPAPVFTAPPPRPGPVFAAPPPGPALAAPAARQGPVFASPAPSQPREQNRGGDRHCPPGQRC